MVFVGGEPLHPSHTALPRFSKATPERPGLESPVVAGVLVLKTDFVRQGEEKAPDGVSGGCDSCRAYRGVHEWLVSPHSLPPAIVSVAATSTPTCAQRAVSGMI